MTNTVSMAARRTMTREDSLFLFGELKIAVLLPCYNEEVTVAQCIRGFRESLPTCTVYVYDNNSSDRTSEIAAAEGAVVRREPTKGKGNVVRRMFGDIDADIYIMADGDATYDAQCAPALVEHLLTNRLDMVVGVRRPVEQEAYRPGHTFGNRLLTGAVSTLFGNRFTDMLSGYRVFSKRFVKSFPALSQGFETETELTIHALELRLPTDELATSYFGRPEGSTSKLSTIRDGVRILRMIIDLFKLERPFVFYGVMAGLLAALSLGLGIPIIIEYLQTSLVPRIPTAILASALMLLAALSLVSGLILDTVTRGRIEMKRLHYLLHGPVPWRIP